MSLDCCYEYVKVDRRVHFTGLCIKSGFHRSKRNLHLAIYWEAENSSGGRRRPKPKIVVDPVVF